MKYQELEADLNWASNLDIQVWKFFDSQIALKLLSIKKKIKN